LLLALLTGGTNMDLFDQNDSQWISLQSLCIELKKRFEDEPQNVSAKTTIQTLSALQGYAGRQRMLNRLLQLSIEDIPDEDLYQRFLDEVLSFSARGKEQQGLLFLKENNHLVIKAHKNVSQALRAQCSRVPYGRCLCGKAIVAKKVLFADSGHRDHDFPPLHPHAHYCVPILAPSSADLGCLTLYTPEQSVYDRDVEEILVAAAQILAVVIIRKKTEHKLSERKELLSSIYSSAENIGLIVTELERDDARITQFSPGAAKMFGYSEEEIIGKSLSVLYRREDRKNLRNRVIQLRLGSKVQSSDRIMRRKNGTDFPVVVSLTPLTDNGGTVSRALGVYNDISELKKTQQELEEVNSVLEKRVMERTQELQLAQQQILHVEKLAAIGQLSASIAHEFNNPLQSVMAVLKGISKRAKFEKEDVDLIESALGECSRMAQLIRDLQDFNRPSPGKHSWVNINQIIESLLLLYKSDFRKKSIQLVRKYSEDLPAVSVIADQIRQVFLNLLNNAMDACGSQAIITIETKTVTGGVQITITDSGCGINPEHLSKIFEPFFTTKCASTGTGLGLSVCYGIVKGHGGSITVDSVPGTHTSFTVTIPGKGTKR
jgi:PAS domain S-box-containing protein